MKAKTLRWFRQQVQRYARKRREFEAYETALAGQVRRQVKSVCPSAIVTSRTKDVQSFAGKLLRKLDKYEGQDMLATMTDLCGIRVAVHLKSEVQAIGKFIRGNFVIDEANTVDAATRLAEDAFGYLSFHYIVQPKGGELAR